MPFENPKPKPETAKEFEISSYYENLIELRDEKPKTFAILAPSTKIALGYYLEAKRKAAPPAAKFND